VTSLWWGQKKKKERQTRKKKGKGVWRRKNTKTGKLGRRNKGIVCRLQAWGKEEKKISQSGSGGEINLGGVPSSLGGKGKKNRKKEKGNKAPAGSALIKKLNCGRKGGKGRGHEKKKEKRKGWPGL